MPCRATLLRLALVGWAALAALLLGGCSGNTGSSSTGPGAGGSDERLNATASFYPLEYVLTKVGGDHVAVSALTKPGVEPHDLELTSQDVAGLRRAALVLYLGGLQPAVDTAVAQQASATGFDVATVANLDLTGRDGASSAPVDDAGRDLHFWLDPQRLSTVGTAVGERLAQLDPAHAADFRANAAALATELASLDTAYRSGLANCTNRQLVTSHAAFGYLASRYGFTQVSIAGLSPDQEPSAKALADVTAAVRAANATTIYAETLVDTKYARTIASSTGARLAVLDPVEGLSATSAGSSYPDIMRANLATLRAGQGCS